MVDTDISIRMFVCFQSSTFTLPACISYTRTKDRCHSARADMLILVSVDDLQNYPCLLMQLKTVIVVWVFVLQSVVGTLSQFLT